MNTLYSLEQLERLIEQFIQDELDNMPDMMRIAAVTILHTFIAWLRRNAERQARKPRRLE